MKLCIPVDLHGLHHELQGNLWSNTWSTSWPSFSTELGVCCAVSFIYYDSSLLYCNSFWAITVLPSQICYHRGIAIISDWLGLGQKWIHLRGVWHWICQTWENLLAAFPGKHPCRSPGTRTLPHKPIQYSLDPSSFSFPGYTPAPQYLS